MKKYGIEFKTWFEQPPCPRCGAGSGYSYNPVFTMTTENKEEFTRLFEAFDKIYSELKNNSTTEITNENS